MRIHPAVELEYEIDGVKSTVEIDIGIALFMKKVWAAGIHTVSSCESLPHDAATSKARGVGGYIWIRLANNNDVKKFASLGIPARRFGRDVYIHPDNLPY